MPRYVKRLAPLALIGLGLPVCIATTGVAFAASGQSGAAPAASGITSYQIKTSAVAIPAAGVVTASATCPSGTKVDGGGVSGSSAAGTSEIIASSAPSGNGWLVTYHNTSTTTAGSFTVYAVCAKGVASNYKSYGQDESASPGGQIDGDTFCPTGTVVLGAGAYSLATNSGLAAASPNQTGTSVFSAVNASGGGVAQSAAVCGAKPSGYKLVTSAAVGVGAGTQNSQTATCPSGTKVLGGGAYTSSPSTSSNLNASYPGTTSSWTAYVNNGSGAQESLQAYAICGKAKAS